MPCLVGRQAGAGEGPAHIVAAEAHPAALGPVPPASGPVSGQRVIRAIARTTLAAGMIATCGASVWAIRQNPFVSPIVERSAEDIRLSVERALAREVTPAWLFPRLGAALAEGDRDRIAMLADLAAAHDIPLDPATQARVDAALADPGLLEGAAGCATCAIDIRSCESLAQIAACAIPFELTPFGDLNALRRQSTAWLYGEEVDEIETGLALAGLAATGAVVVSGGGSYVVKGGLSALRAARRMGALTPAFTRVLGDAADLPVNWGAVLRAAPLSEITDTARLARLTGMGEDLAVVVARTSPADTLVLLRHVETAEDAARLARTADALGPRTRVAMEVLGPARVFRSLTRVSDLALLTVGLLTALAVQLGGLCLSLALRSARRALR
jgi:hypothetical protein